MCERFDIFLERQWAAFFEGWARSELGDREPGLTAMRGFLDLITGAGCLMHHSLYIGLFAEALLRAEAFEEARVWIERGLALGEKTGQRFFECELHRLAGEIEVRFGNDGDRARASLDRALALAVEQDARLLEMRAALSLGTLLMQNGAADDAVRVLSASVARMPAGFVSPEFLQAKAVLQ